MMQHARPGWALRRGCARGLAVRLDRGALELRRSWWTNSTARRGYPASRRVQAVRGREDLGAGVPQADEPERRSELDKVWFYEVRDDGFDPDKISGGGGSRRRKERHPGSAGGMEEIQGRWFFRPAGVGGQYAAAARQRRAKCVVGTQEKLAAADYNLGAGQWKPRTAEKVDDEDPGELVAVVLVDYRQVVSD